MRAFLEHNDLGDWLDDFVYQSKYRLIDLGFEVIGFNGDDPDSLSKYDLDPTKDVIIASVGSTIQFFEQAGIQTPTYLGYPEELEKYLGRKINRTLFGDLLHSETAFPYFIKPANDVKLFTGDVIERKEHLSLIQDFNPGLKEETELFISQTIDIVSEYRCFVFEKDLKGIQYYLGDFRKYPDADLIDQMVNDYISSPVAYTLDVGVTSSGETVLIEVNDMWAIGSYGFDAKMYALMCVRRMKELCRNTINENKKKK